MKIIIVIIIILLIGEISKGMAAIAEDMEAGMKDNDDIFAFLAAVNAAEADGREDFTCPICGGRAHLARSPYNGHIAANCEKCKMRMVE